jgi:hypothetical protein
MIMAIRSRSRLIVVCGIAALVAAVGGGVSYALASSGQPPANTAAKQQLIDDLGKHPSPPPAGTVFQPPPGGDALLQSIPLASPVGAGTVMTEAQSGGVPEPFSAGTITVSNLWRDLVGSEYVSVYAGSLPSNDQQGALFVEDANASGGAPTYASGLRLTPTAAGPVTIESIALPMIELRSSTGAVLAFDLASNAFTELPTSSAAPPSP